MAALVAIVSFLLYAPSLTYQLVWDDPLLIDGAQAIVAREGVVGLLYSEFHLETGGQTSLGYFRPVVLVSLWIDHRLSAFLPFSHHLTNVLLNTLNSLLVFLLLQRLFRRESAALIGSLLFAVHPVHTEAVAFVSGRTDLWATFFLLASVNLWIRESDREENRRRLFRMGSVAALVLATLSKEVAFLLPPVLLFWSVCGGPDRDSPPLLRRPRIPAWLGLWALALTLAVLLRTLAGVGWGTGGSGVTAQVHLSWGAFLAAASKLAHYVKLLLVPWPLNAFYTPDQGRLTPTVVVAALAFLGGCLALSGARHRRTGLVALAWTVGFLLPVLGLVQISTAFVAERYLYTSSIGLSLLVAALIEQLPDGAKSQRTALAIASCLLVLPAGATLARSRVWRDELTFYTELVRSSPRYAAARYNLANTLAALQRYPEALDSYRAAVRLDPFYSQAWYNLGIALNQAGRWEEAVEANRQTIQLQPRNANAFNNLGVAQIMSGDSGAAVASFQAALAIDPAFADASDNLGLAFEKIGQPEMAAQSYRRAILQRPGYDLAHFHLGLLSARAGDAETAREEHRILVRINPQLADELRGQLP